LKAWDLLKATYSTFSRRGGTFLGGGIAFYALLSVAPLLVIALYVAGFLTSEKLARAALVENLAHYLGPTGAATLGTLMSRVERPGAGFRGALAALVILYASTRLFNQLETALDHLWSLPEPPTTSFLENVRREVFRRLLTFGLVLATGLVLVVIVIVKLGYDAATMKLGIATPLTYTISSAVGSLVVCTFLFAAIFRLLPSASFPFRQALLGGAVTALMFSLGAYAISFYLGHTTSVAASYGDAASIVVLLLWVQYSAQIFLLGAAFTGEWVKRNGGFVVDKQPLT
jgi:membrane protein